MLLFCCTTEEWWGEVGGVQGWTGHQLMNICSTPKQLSLTVANQSLGCGWPLKSSHAQSRVSQVVWFWKCTLRQGPRAPA